MEVRQIERHDLERVPSAKALVLVAVVLAASVAGSAHGVTHSPPLLTPVALSPHAVAFWDKERGLIGTGQRFSRGGSSGSILLTTDGGHTARVLVRTPGFVSWIGVAPRGQAWAVVNVCKDDQCSRYLWHSTLKGDHTLLWSTFFQAAERRIWLYIRLCGRWRRGTRYLVGGKYNFPHEGVPVRDLDPARAGQGRC